MFVRVEIVEPRKLELEDCEVDADDGIAKNHQAQTRHCPVFSPAYYFSKERVDVLVTEPKNFHCDEQQRHGHSENPDYPGKHRPDFHHKFDFEDVLR